MRHTPKLEPLPRPFNTAYDPPRPWTCTTFAKHDCDGVVVGVVSPLPVCAAGAEAEIAARIRDAERVERFIADNKELLEAEARAEMEYERSANRY
jgi:hypothetical protein